MTIFEAVRSYLLADTAIAAAFADRIGPAPAPEGGASPYVTFQEISNPRDYTHNGQVTLVRPRFQFDTWAETLAGAVYGSMIVRFRLSGFRGNVTGTTTFTSTTGDVLTWAGLTPINGGIVRVSGASLPTGLVAGTDYHVRDMSGQTCKLAATAGGAAIDLTTAGSGTLTETIYISSIFCDGNERQITEPAPEQEARRRYGVSVDYFIQYHEIAPAFSA